MAIVTIVIANQCGLFGCVSGVMAYLSNPLGGSDNIGAAAALAMLFRGMTNVLRDISGGGTIGDAGGFSAVLTLASKFFGLASTVFSPNAIHAAIFAGNLATILKQTVQIQEPMSAGIFLRNTTRTGLTLAQLLVWYGCGYSTAMVGGGLIGSVAVVLGSAMHANMGVTSDKLPDITASLAAASNQVFGFFGGKVEQTQNVATIYSDSAQVSEEDRDGKIIPFQVTLYNTNAESENDRRQEILSNNTAELSIVELELCSDTIGGGGVDDALFCPNILMRWLLLDPKGDQDTASFQNSVLRRSENNRNKKAAQFLRDNSPSFLKDDDVPTKSSRFSRKNYVYFTIQFMTIINKMRDTLKNDLERAYLSTKAKMEIKELLHLVKNKVHKVNGIFKSD